LTVASVALRPASPADADFIYRLVEVTMRSYVEQTWGSFSEELNRRNIAETIAARNYSIIQCRGEDIGAISVERHPDFIKLAASPASPQDQPGAASVRAPGISDFFNHAGARMRGAQCLS